MKIHFKESPFKEQPSVIIFENKLVNLLQANILPHENSPPYSRSPIFI